MNVKTALNVWSRDAGFRSKSLVVLVLTLLIYNPAPAAVLDSINADKRPCDDRWRPAEGGWIYTPNSNYNLTRVRTKFGSGDTRLVTVEVYDELPYQGGTLLRSAIFSPVANVFAGGSFEPLDVNAGEDYFIGFRNIQGLWANYTSEPGSESVSHLYFGFDDTGTYPVERTEPRYTQPILQFESFDGQITDPCRLDPDKSYRGMAFLSSYINNRSVEEVRNFVADCNLDLVIIDFAWITYHWEETDLVVVEQLAAELVDKGVEVAAMYRPRGPSDAKIHYAQNCDGTINDLYLCFAHEDSVVWGAQWGTEILNALPSVNKVIIYNLRVPCCCPLCQGGQGAVYAQQFMERCRSEWNTVRPGVQIGHVGLGAEYADQVDFFCPFLLINRGADNNPVDVNSLLDDLITPSQVANKPVIPLAKICFVDATDNTTEDIVNAIESCENRQTGFILWYYQWIFHPTNWMYYPAPIIEALGGQLVPVNTPQSWVYFESRESTEGRHPVLRLTFSDGNQDVAVSEDTELLSYLPDMNLGSGTRLTVDMNDTQRGLLRFSLSDIGQGRAVEKAELVLDMKQSSTPTVVSFDLAVHVVTGPWSEQTTTWNSQPAFETTPVIVSIEPKPGLKVIDITEIVSNWLTQTLPNHGLLLKVAHPVGPVTVKRTSNRHNSWVFFESKESTEGQAPVVLLSFSNSDQKIPADQDTFICSVNRDWHYGGVDYLAIKMNDGWRDLLAFSLPSVAPGAILERAELVLDMKQAPWAQGTVVPFYLAVHVVTGPWSEQTANWNNQPRFETNPSVIVSIDPNEGLKVIDITAIVNKWLAKAMPNCGLLLKVPHGQIPDLTYPYEEQTIEPLPWPHQAPWLTPQEIGSLNQRVFAINNFPLYQADQAEALCYFHNGLDIVLDNGTPIYAMKDGWVKYAGLITIMIADRFVDGPSYGWEYSHLSNFQVQVGEFVTKGTFIGEVDFKGVPHIHLAKVFSKGDYWSNEWYKCMPDGHFSYIDEEPPVIGTPFYFFQNNSDTKIEPDDTGKVVLSGKVDIVVPMRERGLYARSKDSRYVPLGFGDRLAVAKIDYEIRPVGSEPGSGYVFHSFDFNNIKTIESIYTGACDELTSVVYKHWKLIEGDHTSWDKFFSYYIITNCSGETSPREINLSDQDYCWDTTELDRNGRYIVRNGINDIVVTAYDFSGHSSTQAMTVELKNPPPGLLVPEQFPTIQGAINAAVDGDIISVAPGVYEEEIDFLGKAIIVQGAPAAAIIDGAGGFAVSFFSDEGPDSLLRNFVIRNSYVAIFLADSSPRIRNVTVCDNEYGVVAFVGAQPDISNSIFWNNTQDDLLFCHARYSCIEDGDEGLGNICEDPLFVDPCSGDFHLRSQGWRWDTQHKVWTRDEVTSRCVDAGNPGSPLTEEPLDLAGDDPDNNRRINLRVNMGAYGDTSEASMPPSDWALRGDLTNDGMVDFKDFAAQAKDWKTYRDEQPGDLDHNGVIDIADLALIAEEWLK